MYIKTKDTSKYNKCTYSNIPLCLDYVLLNVCLQLVTSTSTIHLCK